MAAPTIAQVVAGINNVLAGIEGLRTTAYGPDQINPPAGWVQIPPIDYRATFGARKWKLAPRVVVAVSAVFDRKREELLAEFADHTGAKSIFAAFGGHDSGVNLGGIVETCYVTSFEPLGEITIGQLQYYGGRFQLEISAPGV